VKARVDVTFEFELMPEDFVSLLMRREMNRQPVLAGAVAAMDVATGVNDGAPAPEPSPPPPDPAPAPAPEPVAGRPAPPASPRAARAKAADGNGKTPPAPAIEIPQEADLRALLSRLNAVHPAKINGVVALLKEHGGRSRLNECPPETWPAIWAAAEAIVTAASV